MRRFSLVRTRDVSGISGTGVVAQGVEFDDGVVALHWLSAPGGTDTRFSSSLLLIQIHGHGGDTTIEWQDPPLAALIARNRRRRGRP